MGHIEKRTRTRKDGTKVVTWRARYRTPAGKERVKTCPRKLDAERFLVSVEADKLKGVWVDPKLGRMTVRALAETWYETCAPLAATTRKDYRFLLDQQVLPAFGDLPLLGVDQLALRAWVARLVDGGLSVSRTRHAYAVVSAILETAVADGRLARNVAKGIRLPRIQPREMHFLTAVQIERLAQAIHEPYGTMVRFAAYTGLRAGEIVALRVRSLNLLAGEVRVIASTADVSGKLVTGPTKTYENRTVRLPRFLREELTAYLQGRAVGPDDFVFTSLSGCELRHNNFYKRQYKPAVARAGLDEHLRFHDLRHTCASLLIAQGASVKAIQAHLGHASAVMTLDRYGHLFPSEFEVLADRLDEIHAEAVSDRSGGGVDHAGVRRPARRRRLGKMVHHPARNGARSRSKNGVRAGNRGEVRKLARPKRDPRPAAMGDGTPTVASVGE